MRTIATILAVLMLSGCATLTPEQEFIKQDRAASRKVDREEAQKAWDWYVEACHATKGVVVRSSRLSVRLGRPPAKHETVSCMSRNEYENYKRGY